MPPLPIRGPISYRRAIFRSGIVCRYGLCAWLRDQTTDRTVFNELHLDMGDVSVLPVAPPLQCMRFRRSAQVLPELIILARARPIPAPSGINHIGGGAADGLE